jgi:hypothetical protein
MRARFLSASMHLSKLTAMTNKNIFIILIAFGSFAGSCKKYLQVQPEGAYTEEQVYSNANAIQEALNGLYLEMAETELYGASLSTTIVELLGQRFRPPGSGAVDENYSAVSSYQYNTAEVQREFEAIWKKAYTTILAANLFLVKSASAASDKIMTAAEMNQAHGEAYAIRAMLHFDMLRLFGPVYLLQPDQISIPYYSLPTGVQTPLLPASQVMDSVLRDLNKAEELLSNDPIKTRGAVSEQNYSSGYRNQRLNYYAVKALKARVLLWGGHAEEAHREALAVLEEGEQWFPWLDPSRINIPQSDPDRIFSTEVLFALYNPSLYIVHDARFNAALGDQLVMTSDPTRLADVFEHIDNDYRYNENTWAMTSLDRKTFFKYADVANPNSSFRFLQPMIRKSELYYILAETEPDPQKALEYFNTVRFNRNLIDITNAATLPAEITKEYKKEFWGEGQLFFYYKRKNVTTVPSGSNSFFNVTPAYVVPLPLSETTPR